ncbi:MAG: lactate racemase domain-containing protein [Ardenticatenaceae bacterium]|nr:lactate racemase domain-containing protein [Ardenticatenaceae bacterium]
MVWSVQSKEKTLTEAQIRGLTREVLAHAQLSGRRVLVIIPDGTRSAPIGLFYKLFSELLADETAALDFLIALGTHPPMELPAIQRRIGLGPEEWERRNPKIRILSHEWWRPESFYTAGVIPSEEVARLTHHLLTQELRVALNRMILDYDQLIICGPVYPHEVVGFSGGNKYLFPGIAGQEIIDFTHWLGALLTSHAIIGTKKTLVRDVIERAANLVPIPKLAFCLVTQGEGVAGLYAGAPAEAWSQAADHSAQVHITYLDRPVQRVFAIMPEMYQDIWTAAKGMYKSEPVVAEGGEVILYAPHITEFSYTHGHLIEEIGYHVRDYFTQQWDRFKQYPWGVLAHSTHLRGIGSYDSFSKTESPRIQVTLATGISRERCERANLGYLDPRSIEPVEGLANGAQDVLIVPRAGEKLFRLRRETSQNDQDSKRL